MDWESKQTFLQIKDADSQQAHYTCSKSLIISEMQIKSQFIIGHMLEWLLSKRQRIIIISEDVEKRKPSLTVVGLVNRCNDNGK